MFLHKDTIGIISGGKMSFVNCTESVNGLSVIILNEVTFLYYSFLKALSYYFGMVYCTTAVLHHMVRIPPDISLTSIRLKHRLEA